MLLLTIQNKFRYIIVTLINKKVEEKILKDISKYKEYYFSTCIYLMSSSKNEINKE